MNHIFQNFVNPIIGQELHIAANDDIVTRTWIINEESVINPIPLLDQMRNFWASDISATGLIQQDSIIKLAKIVVAAYISGDLLQNSKALQVILTQFEHEMRKIKQSPNDEYKEMRTVDGIMKLAMPFAPESFVEVYQDWKAKQILSRDA